MEYLNVPILTQEPNFDEGKQDLIFFRRKSTEKNPVKDGDKFRAVLVPSFALPMAVTNWNADAMDDSETQADNVFQLAIREAFFAAAGEILQEYCDSNKEAKEVSLALFSFAAVVAKMQTLRTSQRLNGEVIAAWYDVSETAKEAAVRYTDTDEGKKKQATLRAHYMSLASNNPGITPPLANKMIAYVSDKDTGSNIAKAVLQKLAVVAKKDTSDDL